MRDPKYIWECEHDAHAFALTPKHSIENKKEREKELPLQKQTHAYLVFWLAHRARTVPLKKTNKLYLPFCTAPTVNELARVAEIS